MYRVSELLAKEVISLNEGIKLGTVLNMYFDAKLIYCKYLSIFNDEDGEIKYISFKSLIMPVADALVIKTKDLLVYELEDGLIANPINTPAFNQDGKSTGTVKDIYLLNGKITGFLCGCNDFRRETLLSRSDVLVFNDTPKKIRISKRKTTSKAPKEKSPTTPEIKSEDTPCWFLMNKTIQSDIYKNGTLLFKKGTTIDEQIIKTASQNSRLIQLALYSI